MGAGANRLTSMRIAAALPPEQDSSPDGGLRLRRSDEQPLGAGMVIDVRDPRVKAENPGYRAIPTRALGQLLAFMPIVDEALQSTPSIESTIVYRRRRAETPERRVIASYPAAWPRKARACSSSSRSPGLPVRQGRARKTARRNRRACRRPRRSQGPRKSFRGTKKLANG